MYLIGCSAAHIEAPREPEPMHIPIGYEARQARLVLPLHAATEDSDPGACIEQCSALSRVSSTHFECLSRCPGATVDYDRECPARNSGQLCVEHIVLSRQDPEDIDFTAVEETAVVVTSVAAWVLVVGTVSALCGQYSSDPNCGLFEPPLLRNNPGQVRW